MCSVNMQWRGSRTPRARQSRALASDWTGVRGRRKADAFALEHLKEADRRRIRYAVAALSHKRPSPLEKGPANTGACGVTLAIGTVNYLFDPRKSRPAQRSPKRSTQAHSWLFGVFWMRANSAWGTAVSP